MLNKVVARNEQVKSLKALLRSDRAELVALYGRRRVGKTFLIRRTFEGNKKIIYFNVTGSRDGTMKQQIFHFLERFGEVFLGGVMPALVEGSRDLYHL